MKDAINLLDVVALRTDHADLKLVAGQVGTVVEILDQGVFEVEFVDDQGRTYATATLRADAFLILHYAPAGAL